MRKKTVVHICGPSGVYRYGGFYFEVHDYFGPSVLKKNGDPINRNPPAAFWKVWETFDKLSQADKDLYAA